MSNATWSVTGVLSDLVEDSRRAELHISIYEGIIVLFLRLDNTPTANTVVQAARDLVGESVTATGTIQPHADSKLRSPYFLGPLTLVPAAS